MASLLQTNFVWRIFLVVALFASSTLPNHTDSLICLVRVRTELKPLVIPDIKHWYQSLLSTNQLDSQESFPPVLLHVYRTVFHGFAARLSSHHLEFIKTRPEIVAVFPNQRLRLATTHTPQFLGLLGDHNILKPHGLLKMSNYASNVIIGVLDTGVWPESRSYDDTGLTSIPSHWRGHCIEGQNFTKDHCNNKLLGARYFLGGLNPSDISGFKSARDSDGHGTHTSSTAAGSNVFNSSFYGYALGVATGIAPKARLAVYKVCWPRGGCSTVDIVAAYDKAVEDGVDIISFSVLGFQSPYHLDPIAIAQFGAMEHDVFVSASAGNDGPLLGSVMNLPPWVTTVGAGSMDRAFPANLLLFGGAALVGASLWSGSRQSLERFSPLVYAGDFANHVGGGGNLAAICMPGYLSPKHIRGKIVLCDVGGGISDTLKGEAIKNASGVGMILIGTGDIAGSLPIDAHVLPAITLTASSAEKLFSYLRTSHDPRAKIAFYGTELNVKPAPVVASFSSRGPNTISDSIIKPDLIAPGVNVLAAWPDNIGPSSLPSDMRKVEFNIKSGTSMSCPHISGVVALLRGAYPDWSSSRIKSALMTTSYLVDNVGNELLDEADGSASTVWAYESGYVDPEKAADPGLVYDLTLEDYTDFLCASGYSQKDITTITRKAVHCRLGMNVWDINYPSIAVTINQSNSSKYDIAVKRTATQVSQGESLYQAMIENPPDVVLSVEPPQLQFGLKGQKLSYVVKISAKKFDMSKSNPKSVFGRITWQDGKHLVKMPIAVTQISYDI